MSKVDILSTVIQFPAHIFAKIIFYFILHVLPKAVAEKTNVFLTYLKSKKLCLKIRSGSSIL